MELAAGPGVAVPSSARLATRVLIGSGPPGGQRPGADSTGGVGPRRHVAYDPPRHSLAVVRATR